MTMDLLRFTTAGSVDDGKSTLIGRLLFDSKAILEDQYEAVERFSRSRGDEYVDLALLTDGLRAEREQGITIDVAYRYFATPHRKFIIADTPGHIQYTRNMVTGASTAELAIILIDARNGVVTQSKRHSFLASLLQIPHVVVAVNKMDLAGYDAEVYQQIVDDYREFVAKLDVHDVVFIPISALRGDNVVEPSTRMAWYHGPTLLHHLENVNIGSSRNSVDFRFPVQTVIRTNHGYRGFAGQIASGRIYPGEEVVVFPSGIETRIKSIETFEGSRQEAIAGDSVTLMLADEVDVSRGDMIARKRNLPQISSRIDATICWMDESPMDPNGTYWLQQTTRVVKTLVSGLTYRVDVDTMHREEAKTLTLNEIGRVQLIATQPLFFDPYRTNRATGSFILIDPNTNTTVAAGMIRGASRQIDDLVIAESPSVQSSGTGRSSENVVWEETGVSLAQREELRGHRAAVIWFTGLSGSGKSTIAKKLEQDLIDRGCHTLFLDGDNLRHGLNGDLGFTEEDRQENIRRAAEVAKLGYGQGMIVLCSFISPYRRDRAFARSLLPAGRFVEIFVACDLDICKRRDPKGLYARAARGEIRNFTGVDAPYEAPEQAEMVLDTVASTPEDNAGRIIEFLHAQGLLRSI